MNMLGGKWSVTIILIVLGVIWVGGIATILHFMGTTGPATQAQTIGALPTMPQKHVSLTLETFPNTPTDAWLKEHNYTFAASGITAIHFHPDWVRYGPKTDLTVPAHSVVTITIKNYDGATPILNNFYAQVQGTVGGVEVINGKPVKGLDPSLVSHTFTIHSIPSIPTNQQPWLYVSVPIQGEPDAIESAGADNGLPPNPMVIQFTFVVGDPGQYIWQCFDPCGTTFNGFGGPMQTRGFMNGTFTVQG